MAEQKDAQLASSSPEKTVPNGLSTALGGVGGKFKNAFSGAAGQISAKFALPEPESVMEYQTRDLASWQTYTYFAGTMFQNRLNWAIIVRLVLMSFALALLLICTGFSPRHVHSLHLETLNKTLNFFVGVMLAFFMSSSVDRWVNTVGGCLTLFDSIRNLNMQFLALGVNFEKMEQVTRYGLLSCEFLIIELHMRNKVPAERAEELEKMWAEGCGLEEWEQTSVRETFTEQNRVSSQMWIWVASLLGRMAQDGDIPGMATPTYGRIMNLAQDAQEGIRQVRVSMTVQMPFVYVHTLASLVHLNNICAALDFGAHLATQASGLMWLFGIHFMYSDKLSEPTRDTSAQECFEAIMAVMIRGMIPSMMYQAFLQIGLTLAQPFDESFGPGLSAIPTRKLIDQLRRDIEISNKMAREVDLESGWALPHFKPPPAATAAPPKKQA